MPERYDVIVIGSGAGGGAVAHTLALFGKRILILERGDFLPREMANWDVEEDFGELRHVDGVSPACQQTGTCRFGTDPRTSVLDPDCKAHELDNLFVADTSFFPSIGAVNPALTAIANAIRVGDHIAGRIA